MNKQLWQDVETLFHDALQIEDAKRSEFVKNRAGTNPQLQFEVLTLLKSHDSESGFLEQGATRDWSYALKRVGDENGSEFSRSLGSAIESKGARSTTERDDDQKTKSAIENESTPRTNFEVDVARRIEANRDDFVVKKVINRGGMGTVLRVYQRSLDRDVAVKVLSVTQVDETMWRRFIRESKAAAQIKNDHVVGIHEVCDDADLPFLVMELIEGPSLKHLIEIDNGLKPALAAELARQIALGLTAAHEKHLIHRDIKPANVLLEPYAPKSENTHSAFGFRAKIIDFGLVRDEDNPSGETQDQVLAGTLCYMSPEQLSRPENADHRSDIYSLGITLYQMITGERPFRGAPHMVIRKIELSDPMSPRRLDDRIPKDLESVCLKAISKEPSQRYQTAMEFADDLTRFIESRPTSARPVSTLEKANRWIGRNKRVSIFAGMATSSLILLSVASLIFAITVSNKNRKIDAQDSAISSLDKTLNHQRNQTMEAQVQRVLDAKAGALRFAIANLNLNSEDTLSQIRIEFESEDNDTNRRINAAYVLSESGDFETDFILDRLDQLYATPDVFANTLEALQNDETTIQRIRETIGPMTGLQKHEMVAAAKRIILAAHLGDFEPWINALNCQQNLSVSTEIVHTFPSWHGNLVALGQAIETQSNDDLRWTFSHALHQLDRRSLNQETFENLVEILQRQAAGASDFVSYTSAKQVLRKWNQTSATRRVGPNKAWFERENGLAMVRIEPCTSRMGRLEKIKKYIDFPPHDVTITRPFYISDTEVTVAQYLEFFHERNYT